MISESISPHFKPIIDEIADILSNSDAVRSVILIGSQARGDPHLFSDIDLVVITKSVLERKWFYSLLPSKINIKELSILPYTTTIFTELHNEGSIFIAHVLNEGKILYDDGYFTGLRMLPFKIQRESILFQWDIIKQRLRLYDDLSIYGEVFIDCLSHLYSITKNIAIVTLALRGELIFNKEKALKRFSLLYPDLRDDLNELIKLKPFSLIWSKDARVIKPFKPTHCKSKTEVFINKLHRIINVVEYYEIKAN